MSAPFSLPYRTPPDTLDAIRADIDHMLGRVARAEAEPDPTLGADAVEVLCRKSRELFTRRALEEAAEHAAALLPSLGLPRLVTADFVPLDREVALDALDAAIVALDALDADPDLEPSLGYYTPGYAMDGEAEPEHDEDDGTRESSLASPERSPWVPHGSEWRRHFRDSDGSQARWAAGAQHDGEAVNEDGDTLDDGEHDTADLEWSCGWTAKVDQVHLGQDQDDHEETALERHGRGLVRSGPDDAEDDELGDDRDPAPVAWVFGPSRRGVAHI